MTDQRPAPSTDLRTAVAAARAAGTAHVRLSYVPSGPGIAKVHQGLADLLAGTADTATVWRMSGRPDRVGERTQEKLSILDFLEAHDEPAPGPFAFTHHGRLRFTGETDIDEHGRLVRVAWQSRFRIRPRLRVGPFKLSDYWMVLEIDFQQP
jgi:hypothetical protein